MAVNSIDPEKFGRIFRSEDFEKLYRCTSKNLQQLIPFEQFIELAISSNKAMFV